MDFMQPLVPGVLMRRYKRFLAEVQLQTGEIVTVHCANTGALAGVSNPGERVWIRPCPGPGRACPYAWEMVEQQGQFIGVNTGTPSKLVKEAFSQGKLFQEYETLRPEVTFGDSRLDFYLEGPSGKAYVEVKNVHLKRGEWACFPDAVTSRGKKHLYALEKAASEGIRAINLYIIQRQDCAGFQIAGDIDPGYAQVFQSVQGVEFWAYSCHLSPNEITLGESLPVLPPFYA